MDEKYLFATVRYVERNPVAARLCSNPEDWKWSSAVAHLTAKDDALVRVKPMLERVNGWGEYLGSSNNYDEQESIKLNSRTGRPLGSPEFVRKLEILSGRELAVKKPGRKPLARK